MSLVISWGWVCTMRSKLLLVTTITLTSSFATADADRGLFSSRAISPKMSPGLSMASITSLSSTILLIFTTPRWMMYSSVPGSFSLKIIVFFG